MRFLGNGTPSRAADFEKNQRFLVLLDTLVSRMIVTDFPKVSNVPRPLASFFCAPVDELSNAIFALEWLST